MNIDSIILWSFVFTAAVAIVAAVVATFAKVETKLTDIATWTFWVSAIVWLASAVAMFLRLRNS